MNRSPTRCQVVAFTAGVLLFVAAMGGMFLLHWAGWNLNDEANLAVQLLLTIVLPTAATCWVAIYSHPYQKVVWVTTLAPVALIFLAGYAIDIESHISTSARHMMNLGLGFTHPLDFTGQALKVVPFLLWAGLIGALSLLIKKLFVREDKKDREEMEDDRFFTPFTCGLIVLAVGGTIVYSVVVGIQNTPFPREAWARKILESPESTDSERSRALFELLRIGGEGARDILQAAARDQSHPLNVLAASFLANRNDISGLPLLETQLMQSGTLKGKNFRWNIASSLSRIENPEAIPALTRLMKASDPETRQGAIQALRTIGGDSVIDPLVAGLYDSDWGVRWISVMGLTEVVKIRPAENTPFPDSNQFKTNEKLCLDYWKEWAARRELQ